MNRTNRIAGAFGKGKAFIAFITGGDPSIEKSEEYILKMLEAGADIIEIGIPFSDPIAEGPTIQNANIRALAAGTTVDKLFSLVESLRKKTEAPLLFMSYLNPVFHYGYERFFSACEGKGVDGIIIPDLPFEEHGELADTAAAHGVTLISMIAPSSEARLGLLIRPATGFIYTVASMGVTGVRSQLDAGLDGLLKKIKSEATIPVAAGFGIGTAEQARQVARYADGVIVGSAIVRLVEQHGANAASQIFEFVSRMKSAISS
ncbi:tryptophan synthase subunit alpha [Desulfovibrio sp. OttesenSCG-928-A18]|nr:tryptophan synthase subunit alpha [Desulfovibrio sp. OttesenSCG-928-A18]